MRGVFGCRGYGLAGCRQHRLCKIAGESRSEADPAVGLGDEIPWSEPAPKDHG
jgi:hypothetical protein